MATVLVPVADGSEEIEAVTVIDLLRRADIEVVVAGLGAGPVTASRGVVITPDVALDEALERDYDMIVLPGGGPGAEKLAADRRINRLLEQQLERGAGVGAICAAPAVLAKAGLLRGRRATSFPGALDGLDHGAELAEEPVVEDGPLVTSRGPGTAMDFALALIERLAGRGTRDRVEAGLQRPAR